MSGGIGPAHAAMPNLISEAVPLRIAAPAAALSPRPHRRVRLVAREQDLALERRPFAGEIDDARQVAAVEREHARRRVAPGECTARPEIERPPVQLEEGAVTALLRLDRL